MPPKKATTKSTKATVKAPSDVFTSNNMQLYKLVEDMTKNMTSLMECQQKFNDNFESLQNYQQEEMNNLDYQLKLRSEECYNKFKDTEREHTEKMEQLQKTYNERSYQLEQEHLKKMDQLERDFDEREMELANEVMGENNKTVVDTSEYDKMRAELENYESRMAETEKRLVESHHKELNARLATMKLQHQVESSDMSATIKQQEKEIKVLNETITTLKAEIQAQRKLTESVANATQKQLTQNFGK